MDGSNKKKLEDRTADKVEVEKVLEETKHDITESLKQYFSEVEKLKTDRNDRPEDYSPEDVQGLTNLIRWNIETGARYEALVSNLQKAIIYFPAEENRLKSELAEIKDALQKTTKDYNKAVDDLDKLKSQIEKQKEEVEKQKRQLERDRKAQAEIEKQLTQPGFINIPTSPTTNLILDFLISGGDAEQLPARQQLISHGEKIKVEKKGKSIKITEETKDFKIIIETGNIDKITGNNGTARKLFTLIMQKANEQALFNGKLTRDYVVFPLHELVDRGIFKTVRGARQGFDESMEKLEDFKILLTTTKKGKNVSIEDKYQDGQGVLFSTANIELAQCYVFLNDHLNCWKELTQFYTMIPNYYYSLSDRAADLLYYIFYLARQNADKISKQGYFTISYRAIQARLKLPSEVKLKNPQRDIKDVIDKTLEEIEEKNREGNYQGIDLYPEADDDAKISEYLNKGYLKVIISEDLQKNFSDIYETSNKKRKAAEKRRNQIEDKAKAAVLEKKIENNTKQSS